jgi:hypothetical protein
MAMLDYFNTQTGIFSPRSLTDTINKVKYRPRLLGQLGIFTPRPIDTLGVAIEELLENTQLVPIKDVGGRGRPAAQSARNMRSIRALNCLHLKLEDRVAADEIPVRAYGSEQGIENLAIKVDQKLALLKNKFEATMEYMRSFALKGLVVDDAGSTLLNYFNEFGVTANGSTTVTPLTQTTVQVATNVSTTDVRNKFIDMKRAIEDVTGIPCTRGTCVLGKTLFDAVVAHETVKPLWNNAQQLLAIQGFTDYRAQGFQLGGFTIYEYRGGTSVTLSDGVTAAYTAVADAEGYAWDADSDIFRCYLAPNDTLDGLAAGAMGSEFYSYSVVEPEQTGIRLIAQSNPLFVCTRPDAVIKITV